MYDKASLPFSKSGNTILEVPSSFEFRISHCSDVDPRKRMADKSAKMLWKGSERVITALGYGVSDHEYKPSCGRFWSSSKGYNTKQRRGAGLTLNPWMKTRSNVLRIASERIWRVLFHVLVCHSSWRVGEIISTFLKRCSLHIFQGLCDSNCFCVTSGHGRIPKARSSRRRLKAVSTGKAPFPIPCSAT